MVDKTLWIHAGGPKAGSSALQSFCEKRFAQLKDFDFAYENRLRATGDFEFESGNGVWLCDALASGKREDQVDEIVRRYFGECNNAICSSEFFSLLGRAAWRELYRSSLRLGVGLKVIFYVRNAIPILMSGYDQAIKRHGEARDFSVWALTADWPHFQSLKLIANEIPISNIIVLSYDRNKETILRSFLAALALETKLKFDPDDERRKVNRSLKADEREILRKVNRQTGGAYCWELSRCFVDANPTATGEPVPILRETIQCLHGRFASEADWINRTFFNDEAIVEVLPSEPGTIVERGIGGDRKFDGAHQIALWWAIERLGTVNAEATLRLVDALSAASMRQAERPTSVPDDFDPTAYLILNPDLVTAGVDPFVHYVNHGREEGRLFKFEGSSGSREKAIAALNSRILILEELLRQSAISLREALRRADLSKRELSYKLALEVLRGKKFWRPSNWFRRLKRPAE